MESETAAHLSSTREFHESTDWVCKYELGYIREVIVEFYRPSGSPLDAVVLVVPGGDYTDKTTGRDRSICSQIAQAGILAIVIPSENYQRVIKDIVQVVTDFEFRNYAHRFVCAISSGYIPASAALLEFERTTTLKMFIGLEPVTDLTSDAIWRQLLDEEPESPDDFWLVPKLHRIAGGMPEELLKTKRQDWYVSCTKQPVRIWFPKQDLALFGDVLQHKKDLRELGRECEISWVDSGHGYHRNDEHNKENIRARKEFVDWLVGAAK